MNSHRLRIYRSGAGSGKTFKLGIIYLNLVLQQPTSFRQILGITFTNKAAAELKKRILSYLAALATDRESSLKTVLIENLAKEGLKLSPDDIALKAREALGLILHNYGEFAVSTIDSFMYRVVSTFTFDLRIAHDFEVILDTAPLVEETADRIMSKVGLEQDITLVLEITLENQIDDEKGWNLRSLLQKTTESLFREDTRHHLPELLLMKPSELLETTNKVRQTIQEKFHQIQSIAKECMRLLSQQGLHVEDFYQGNKGAVGWLKKASEAKSFTVLIPKSSYVDKALNEDLWFPKSKVALAQTFEPIKSTLRENLEKIVQLTTLLPSLQRISDALPSLALTGTLAQELEALKKEENFLHISDFNELIRHVIINEPVPYIYYRLGSRFKHYLLDEFQDTSVSQWHNLVPLLANSLAESYSLLAGVIVGDGKQSIYRFRNGELQIFEQLPKIYQKPTNQGFLEAEKLFEQNASPESLDTNRRSEKNIVEFNNQFFSKIVENLSSEYHLVREVYKDIRQTPHKTENKGYVEWNIVEKNKDAEDNLDPQAQRVLDKILELKSKGYAWKDMAVLVRRGTEGQAISTLLGTYGIPVLSSDSLLLNTSPRVLKVIAWLYYLQNPEDDYYRVQVLSFYNKQEKELYQLKQQFLSVDEVTREFLQIDYQQLMQKDLYSLCEYLLMKGEDHSSGHAHGQTLLEYVQRLINQKKSSIADLLSAWEDSGDKWSVSLTGETHAVQVMTIHKAKGLEFNIVIIPFLFSPITDWEKGWLPVPEEKTRVHLENVKLPPVILTSVNTKEEDMFFSQELREIREKKLLDRLNILYVAFTRAIEQLYIFSEPFPKSPSDELKKAVLETSREFGKGLDESESFSYPSLPAEEQPMPMISEEMERRLPSLPSFTYQNRPWEQRFKIRRQAPEEWLPGTLIEARKKGISLHRYLSLMTEQKDFPLATQSNKKGSPEETAYEEILSQLKLHPLYNEIFLPHADYLSEREIAIPGEGILRPDLLIVHESGITIVDYKTGAWDAKHERQIQLYSNALQNADYQNIKGYLIYINESVEIKRVV
ncbi:MAG: UvrD-helicase domain-containing protein [Bacteroidales bacterium]